MNERSQQNDPILSARSASNARSKTLKNQNVLMGERSWVLDNWCQERSHFKANSAALSEFLCLRRKLFGHQSTMDGRRARNKSRCLQLNLKY